MARYYHETIVFSRITEKNLDIGMRVYDNLPMLDERYEREGRPVVDIR